MIFLSACEKSVKITTPERDARKCFELIHNSKTPKELDKNAEIVARYVEAYQNAVYEGKVTVDDLETFLDGVRGIDN